MKRLTGIFAVACLIVMTASALCAADGNPEDGKKNAAVVYFSATGTTKAVAEMVANAASADIYEIVPATPYSAADLNYNNSGSRANRERNDPSARPEIAGDMSAAQERDVLFIGYPIWFGRAPRIINTFIEAVDLTGAEIYLFCTSGSSGIGASVSDLRAAYPSLDIKDGRRLNGATASEIGAWVDGLVSENENPGSGDEDSESGNEDSEAGNEDPGPGNEDVISGSGGGGGGCSTGAFALAVPALVALGGARRRRG